jgi:hypothetical protein
MRARRTPPCRAGSPSPPIEHVEDHRQHGAVRVRCTRVSSNSITAVPRGTSSRGTGGARTTGPSSPPAAIVSSRRRRDAHHRSVPAVNPRPVLYVSAVSPLARQPAIRGRHFAAVCDLPRSADPAKPIGERGPDVPAVFYIARRNLLVSPSHDRTCQALSRSCHRFEIRSARSSSRSTGRLAIAARTLTLCHRPYSG